MSPAAAHPAAGSTSFLLEAYWQCSEMQNESTMKAMAKFTRILGFELQATSPHEAATGHTTGRVRLNPVVISKYVDKSTPLEYNALLTNKLLKESKIAYFANKADGSGKIKQFEITLKNVHIIDVHSVAVADATGVTETVTMTYEDITILDVPSTIQTQYNYTEAV